MSLDRPATKPGRTGVNEPPWGVVGNQPALMLGVAVLAGLVVALLSFGFLALKPQVQAMALTAPVGVGAGLVALRRFDLFVLGLLVARPTLDALNVGGTKGGALDPAAGAGAVFVATGLLWLVAQWSSGSLAPVSFPTKGLLALSVAGMASTLVSAEPLVSAEANVRLLGGVLMFAVLEQMLQRRPDFARWVVGAVFLSFVIPALVGANQVLGGAGITGPDGTSRVFGTFAHPNPFGTYLVTVLLLATAVAAGQWGWWRRVAVVVAGASGALLLFTYARGAWMAAVIGFLYLGLRQSARLLWVVLATLVVALLLAPSAIGRITDLTEEHYTGDSPQNSLAWRIEYWGEIVPLASPSPLNGIGLEMVQRTTREGLQPHNVFVQVYAEMGLFGAIALGATLVGFVTYLAERRRTARTDWDRTLSAAAVAVTLAFAVQLPSENLLTQGIALWFLAAGSTFGAGTRVEPAQVGI